MTELPSLIEAWERNRHSLTREQPVSLKSLRTLNVHRWAGMTAAPQRSAGARLDSSARVIPGREARTRWFRIGYAAGLTDDRRA